MRPKPIVLSVALLTLAALGGGSIFPAGAAEGPGTSGIPDESECTITGNNKANTINGTPGDDVICGNGGRDEIDGRGGSDTIYGGHGADRIKGGPLGDNLLGDPGDDILIGGRGGDEIWGGHYDTYVPDGADEFKGGKGDDCLISYDTVSGNDSLDGGPGTDISYRDAGDPQTSVEGVCL